MKSFSLFRFIFMAMVFYMEIAFSQSVIISKKYRGSFSSVSNYTENINLAQNQIAEPYKLTVVNGNGVVFVPNVCSGGFIKRILCNIKNTINQALYNLSHVKQAAIVINNNMVVSPDQINRDKLYYETAVSLQTTNLISISVEGPITSSISVELKYLGENVDKTPPIIMVSLNSGSLTNNKLIHISITDKSEVSTDIYKEGLLQETVNLNEFDLTLTEGANNFVLKSKDSNNNQALDYSLTNITLDTIPPSVITDLNSTYVTDVFPLNVTAHFTSNEELSLAEVNGTSANLETPYSFSYLIGITDPGVYEITVKAQDKAGNEIQQTYSYAVEESFSLIVESPTPNQIISGEEVTIKLKSNKPMDALYLNDVGLGISSDHLSAQKTVKLPLSGAYTFKARAIAGTLEKSKDIRFTIGNNTVAPWVYEECSAP